MILNRCNKRMAMLALPIIALPICIATASSQQWIVETGVRRLKAQVVNAYPHDREAFTQGLLYHGGKLYESTGLYGKSSLRRVDLDTGGVEHQVSVPAQYFAEGLVLVGDRLVQLTWRENTAIVYNVDAFDQVGEYAYEGQGWGICFDGANLIMSDGSANLTFRDSTTFDPLGVVTVTLNGNPVSNLNELEFVDGFVYANVWRTNEIVQVKPDTGEVVAVIDASGLLTAEEAVGTDVLNGIAYDAAGSRFLITGKLWPKLFEVRFVPAD